MFYLKFKWHFIFENFWGYWKGDHLEEEVWWIKLRWLFVCCNLCLPSWPRDTYQNSIWLIICWDLLLLLGIFVIWYDRMEPDFTFAWAISPVRKGIIHILSIIRFQKICFNQGEILSYSKIPISHGYAFHLILEKSHVHIHFSNANRMSMRGRGF